MVHVVTLMTNSLPSIDQASKTEKEQILQESEEVH